MGLGTPTPSVCKGQLYLLFLLLFISSCISIWDNFSSLWRTPFICLFVCFSSLDKFCLSGNNFILSLTWIVNYRLEVIFSTFKMSLCCLLTFIISVKKLDGSYCSFFEDSGCSSLTAFKIVYLSLVFSSILYDAQG